MTTLFDRSRSLHPRAALLFAAVLLTSCGGSTPSTPTAPQGTVLLDTTVSIVQGVTCATGGVSVDFAGTSGRTVVIAATGAASLTPRFTLYAPDFATQLGGSTATGSGAASLTFALTQTGVHHVSLCDLNGVAGPLRVVVTQQP